ncbi:hypothetical protein COLO4_28675 [Corchorus olitorius]|uniref:non-specific serine/threonine protein kinase n=1 Tax=Corchorus olitorius TaxID=93759 RepID=A0A1R3HIT7_9ROSI|nr:hypothetical protein COLO4_28675 [Corchorus olitorius]
MEWNPETLEFLSQCFLHALSPQLETRRAAESSLSEAADTPNYGLSVLRLVVEPSVNDQIRQAAAINFKSYIRTRWVPSNDPKAGPAFSSIRKQEKEQIKTLLVSLMLSSSPRIQSELSEALAVIGKHDFPKLWASRALTPKRFFWRPFQPPSLAKHIKASLVKWLWGKLKLGLDFRAKYELGKELGRGMFGYTFSARAKTVELKDQLVAVKIISKVRAEHWTEDAMREIKILRTLSGHKHFIKFYDACQDDNNVYIVMEGGRYTEEDAKAVVTQILSAVSFCHLQGIVHRDLKPQNLLLTSAGEDAELKLIDFGLSDFIRPGSALSKALTEDVLVYLRAQFRLLEPNRDGSVSLENFKMALSRNATDIMDESWVPETLSEMGSLANGKMYFEEFCAAAIHICHLEGVEEGEQIVLAAFEHFEQEGNQVISEEKLCQEMNMSGPEALSYVQDCIRKSDGKLNFIGFTKLLGL